MDRARSLVESVAARGGPRLGSVEWPVEIVSTSDRLKALARAGAPEWTAVLADRQTGGRGREGRRWASPAGGLYLSVLLRPRPGPAGLLPLAAGVAVAEAAEELGVGAALKWPNDVLAGGRKLAGILCEAASGPSGLDWVCLGLGVNVTTDLSALPADLAGSVTSLAAQGGREVRVAEVAAAVLVRLARGYETLRAAPSDVVRAWRARSVGWWGELVEATAGGAAVRGVLADVDEDGALVLALEGGARRRLLSGEVRQVRRVGRP